MEKNRLRENKFGQLIDASFQPFFNLIPHFRNLKITIYRRTNQKTDGPTDERTNGWTDPLIEMRGRI